MIKHVYKSRYSRLSRIQNTPAAVLQLHCNQFAGAFLLFPQCWFPGFYYFHVLSFLQVFVMVSLLVVSFLLFASVPLILIFSQISFPYMVLLHLCTYIQRTDSDEGSEASCWALVCGFQHSFCPIFLTASCVSLATLSGECPSPSRIHHSPGTSFRRWASYWTAGRQP